MSSQSHKPSKPSKNPSPTKSRSSSLSTHLAMVELKHRILTSISKLSDRDTHQIAVEDLETIIQTLSIETIPMFLNCLYEASADPKPSLKKESIRLLALLCNFHANSTATHLPKIISHIVKRLRDCDSGVIDSCRDAIGALTLTYLKGDGDGGGNLSSVVALFVKPLFETMGDQNKAAQGGAAICLAKMVECAVGTPITVFQKLCPRICKYLNNHNFLAKAALLSVVARLSQVGAISAQTVPTLLQSIHDCLGNSDWATRKAAADTLSTFASHSSHLFTDRASSTITTLEACRFDKVKPVRDSMTEALQQWKKIIEKGGSESVRDPIAISSGEKCSELIDSTEKLTNKRTSSSDGKSELAKDPSDVSGLMSDSLTNTKGISISEKTVGILRKKAPSLTDKELNVEFFQSLETRDSDDLPIEVMVSRRFQNSSDSKGEEELDPGDEAYQGRPSHGRNDELNNGPGFRDIKLNGIDGGVSGSDNQTEERAFRGKDYKLRHSDVHERTDGHAEGSYVNNKGNWLAMQRQLSQLERQQTNLMHMLQEFMGESHDNMLTLENRVRRLERVVEDMTQHFAISSGRRASNLMVGFEGSSSRTLGKYNSLPDYSSTRFGRVGDGWSPFAERFFSSDGIVSGVRARDPPLKSELSETRGSHSYGVSRNGYIGSRRVSASATIDNRPVRSGNDYDQVSNRRAWNKGPGSVKLGEGPSARSVWQASKDEATLEAIRVAGEDNGTSRPAQVAIPEMTAETTDDNNAGGDQELIWAVWRSAMDALRMGDVDAAYAEILSTGDDALLIKLMDRSGPVMDQLSSEIVCEVLQAIGQFIQEESLSNIGLYWTQQLVDIVMENGPDALGIPLEYKNEILLSLHEASLAIDPPHEWEGATPDQLMLQLASTWGIDLQQFDK